MRTMVLVAISTASELKSECKSWSLVHKATVLVLDTHSNIREAAEKMFNSYLGNTQGSSPSPVAHQLRESLNSMFWLGFSCHSDNRR